MSPEKTETEAMPKLEDLNFDIELASENEPLKEDYKRVQIIYEGKILDVRINKYSLLKREERAIKAKLGVDIFLEKRQIGFLTLGLWWPEGGECEVGSDVSIYRGHDSAGLGLGRALCEMLPKSIQKIANAQNTPVTDEIIKAPRGGLTSEKWDEVFQPLLEKYGYSPAGKKQIIRHGECDTWKKTYLPEKAD